MSDPTTSIENNCEEKTKDDYLTNHETYYLEKLGNKVGKKCKLSKTVSLNDSAIAPSVGMALKRRFYNIGRTS